MKTQNQQPALKTLEDVNAALASIAALTTLAQKDEAKMNERILAVKKECETKINDYLDKIELYESQLREFGKSNSKLFMGKKRSIALTYGIIGFRKGVDALSFISKKFNAEFAKQKMLDLFGAKYVDTVIKLNKRKILSDLKKGILTIEKIAAAGLKKTNKEKFYYDINWDEIKIDNIEK